MKFRVGQVFNYNRHNGTSETATIVKITHDVIHFDFVNQNGHTHRAWDPIRIVMNPKWYKLAKPTHTKLGKVLYK